MSNDTLDAPVNEISGGGSQFASETLLNAPRGSLEDGLDIALFGIPFDGGSTLRPGSRHGPQQMRHMSLNIRQVNHSTRINPFDLCKVADIGDTPLDLFDQKRNFELISAYCKNVVASGAIPLAAGGDHAIALPCLRGVASTSGPVAVVHFDAHPDTMDELAESRYNHATPFRRAVEEGLEDPTRHVMIGIRGTWSNDYEAFDWAEAQGMTILWIDDCFALGPEGVAAKVREVIGDHPTYLSLDVDGVDPADIPGTCSPEPGGLRMRDMQVILRGLRGMNFVGGDINEVSPPLDPTGYSALNADHLLFEMLCLCAESRASK